MDFQTISPPAPNPSASTLRNAAVDKAEGNESIIARSYTNTIEYDRTSLEKTSDPSNVLEERSHPLQRTAATALQGPLTASNNSVLATISLPLPRELVERILLLLDTKSTLKCRLVNKELNAITQFSTLVQYHLACDASSVIDNAQSPLSYAERLQALKKREDAWRKLKPAFETKIRVNNPPSTFSEMSAGIYFLNDKNRKDLYYCHFPSSLQDNPQWFRLPDYAHGQSLSPSIVEVGIAVSEHDLVVNVISSEVGNQADTHRYSLDLVLLKFSTGEYHPLARHSLIHVQRSGSAKPYISVRIVGDNLALVVYDEDGSKLFIFDWKTSHKRLQHKAAEDAYYCSVPVFVSPELLLVPNCILPHFEVWHFPSHANRQPPVQILSLQIPAISKYYSVRGIYCHGEPSPFLHSIPCFPPRPFFPSSEDSIITANLYLKSLPRLRSAYKLIVHRRALLDVIQKWSSPTLLERQTWFTNEVTLHGVADPDDGSVRLCTQSESVSAMPHSKSSPRHSSTLAITTFLSSHISADTSAPSIPSGSALFKSRFDILQVQWADWGPPISRWFQMKKSRTRCINQSTGQRCVFLDPNPRDKGKCMISVADFNLYNVRRNPDMMAQLSQEESEDNGSNGKGKKEENEESEKLDHEGEFSEEVYMGLKCVVHRVPGEYDFDVVLMDEERLLGLKVGDQNREESINVLYFG